MKILINKLLRTIIKNWVSFFSAFLMIFLSVLFYVGLQGTWQGMNKSVSGYTQQQNLASSWVQASFITEGQLSQIERIEGVDKVETSQHISTSIQIKGSHESYNMELMTKTANSNISKTTLLSGKAVKQENEININRDFAKENNISLGDVITSLEKGQQIKLKVVGIVISPENIYFTGSSNYMAPQFKHYGYGIVSNQQTQMMAGTTILRIKGEVNSTIPKKIKTILGSQYITYQNQATNANISTAVNRVNQIKNLSLLFSALFSLLAFLAVYTTIQRLIVAQRKDIAILRALGYSERSILFYYTSYGFVVGISAIILAWIFSPFLSNFVLKSQETMFTLPYWRISYKLDAVLISVIAVFISTISAFFAANGGRGEALVDVLSGKEISKVKKRPLSFKNLNIGNRWAFRDSLKHPVRTFMSIIGVSGGIALIMIGLGTWDTMNHQVNQSFGREFKYKTLLQIKPNSNLQEVDDLKKQMKGNLISNLYTEVKFQGKIVNEPFTIIESTKFLDIKDLSGNTIKDKGVYITEGLANKENIKRNDEIVLNPALTTASNKFVVKGILKVNSLQGIYMTKKAYQEAGYLFSPTALMSDNWMRDKNSLISQIISLKSQRINGFDMVKNLTSIFMLILGFGIVLTLVISYNLGSLGFIERKRDYATLYVLGLTIKEIRNLTMIETVITTFVGVLIGIPFGYLFLSKYVTIFTSDQIVYYTYISFQSILIAVMITILASLSSIILTNRRIKSLDMTEALKNID
ncbi:ABC transporter permease [Lactococcus sp.]|uniref:ABC transporter permease n=1 Tax=Lactococcus sp. TaxID=44273 RepID=UPI002FCB4FD0